MRLVNSFFVQDFRSTRLDMHVIRIHSENSRFIMRPFNRQDLKSVMADACTDRNATSQSLSGE